MFHVAMLTINNKSESLAYQCVNLYVCLNGILRRFQYLTGHISAVSPPILQSWIFNQLVLIYAQVPDKLSHMICTE